MREKLTNGVIRLASKVISPHRAILRLARVNGIDLLMLAYHCNGILKYHNEKESGEEHLWNVLQKVFGDSTTGIIIDCGANTGDLTVKLSNKFPRARILSLEPNPASYAALETKTRGLNVEAFPVGLSASAHTSELYFTDANQTSEHASLYADVSRDLHRQNGLVAAKVNLVALDDFAASLGIEEITFLKVDTEGHELSALQGAPRLLSRGAIHALQFEFNEMNVVSRVFLRDFYKLMPNYSFFRLDENRLITLGEYSSRNEIFKFQNIVAFNDPTMLKLRQFGLI